MAWGIAWTGGFLALYAAFVPVERPLLRLPLGLAIGLAVLVTAIVVSAVHSARRSAGSRGPSAMQGVIYGNTFGAAFTLVSLLGWRLMDSGVPLAPMLSYWVAATCLVVGPIFVVGAAMWNDKSQLIFGCWTLLVGFVSIALAPPHNLLAGAAGASDFLCLPRFRSSARGSSRAGSRGELMDELDPVIHVQTRLRIVTILDAFGPGDSLSFPRLQKLLGVTSGNLATHLRKLEDSGYVHVRKVLEGRNPVTYIGLTEDGRLAFRVYKRRLRVLLEDPLKDEPQR